MAVACVPVVLDAHTEHVYSRCFPPSLVLHATSCAFSPRTCFVTTTLRAMENVTVRESARLRACRAESGTAHPQSSTQPGSDPAATATPSTAQPGAALADGLPGTTDITPSQPDWAMAAAGFIRLLNTPPILSPNGISQHRRAGSCRQGGATHSPSPHASRCLGPATHNAGRDTRNDKLQNGKTMLNAPHL